MKSNEFKAILAGFVALIAVLIGFFIGVSHCMTADADTTMGFQVIDKDIHNVKIVYDIETGVMYTMSTASYNIGSMTLMVNPDGTPRVYEGFGGK